MKLFYGGFGAYFEYAVAETEEKAIEIIGKKINAPFLPITAKEISEVDGFAIQIAPGEKPFISENPTETESTLRHCKKCDFTCETQGQLLAHYREQHPKGD